MTSVVIIDYGMGNLRSVAKAIEHVRPATTWSSPPTRRVAGCRAGGVPGAGRDARLHGSTRAAAPRCAIRGFLGICIGQQMLFQLGAEGDAWGLAARRS